MPQHPYDDDDLAAALNFSGAGGSVAEDDGEQPAAWDFSVPDDESAVEAMAAHVAPEPDEDAVPLLTVTNPPGSVSVSVLRDGGIDRVGLSANATRMTESQLADEILVIAQLARQKGQAAQHTFLLDALRQAGETDTAALRDLLEDGMNLSSPERAEATQAQVFANRYRADR